MNRARVVLGCAVLVGRARCERVREQRGTFDRGQD